MGKTKPGFVTFLPLVYLKIYKPDTFNPKRALKIEVNSFCLNRILNQFYISVCLFQKD